MKPFPLMKFEEVLVLPRGGLQAEWSLPPCEASIEVDLGAHTGEWHALNLETDAADTRTCGLGSDAEWVWLAGRVGMIRGAVN